MPLAVQCPNPKCAAPCALPDGSAGQSFRCPKCQTPLTPKQPPRMIGRYQVRAQVGSGAFGTVYLAYDPQLDREVALKLLKPEALSAPGAVERFRREARAAARMFHPNIVPVHDAGQHGDSHYITSAFVAGRSLASAVPAGGMAPRRAAALTAQLLDALAYAHARGVLHRDVKPANVLLDERDHVYLTDFGLAVWTEQDTTRLTREGAVIGTPAFMSPEQAMGDPSQVGPAADQYSAAVALYQLLTGRLPFEGTLTAILYLVAHRPPLPPSQRRPGLDPALDAICLKALAKRAADRYADAGRFADALRDWLGESAPAPALGSTVPVPPPLPVSAPETGAEDRVLADTQGSPSPPARPPSRTAAIPAPTRRRGAGRAALWAGGLALAAAAAALLWFVASQASKPTGERPAEGPDLKEDVEALQRLVRKGIASTEYVKERGPRRLAAWRAAAERGSAEGQFLLARCYELGVGVDKNEQEAVAWLKKSADQGFALAQNNLGVWYGQGLGVEKDPKQEVEWFRKAAEQGVPVAQVNLGICYIDGKGVDKDPKQAVEWYRKAAEQGLALAQYKLGLCYYNGEGVDKDPKQAVEWLRKAAEQGSAMAQTSLGWCYQMGEGVDKTPKLAVEWFRKAADQGLAAAQNELGLCYYNGEGVDKDPKQAVEWFRKAAAQGLALAQRNLGVCYQNGLGVDKDPKQAAEWYQKAADQGDADAKKALEELKKK